jgi:hypothetical protein
MPHHSDVLGPLLPPDLHLTPTFSVLLLTHVLAGLTGVITGAIAALSPKRRGRHPRAGTVYYGSLSIVFLTAAGMGLLRWTEDWHLVVLGTVSFAAGSVAYAARKICWRGWLSAHITGMGVSYVVLLTAFYVDNGPRLPVWDRLPPITYWTLPALVGTPLILRAIYRYTRLKTNRVSARDGTRRT